MSNSSLGLVPSSDDWMIADEPDAQIDTSTEKKLGRLSRSKAWREVNNYLEDRIGAYSQYLPGSNPAITGSEADWRVADGIVKELRALQGYVDTIAHGISADA